MPTNHMDQVNFIASFDVYRAPIKLITLINGMCVALTYSIKKEWGQWWGWREQISTYSVSTDEINFFASCENNAALSAILVSRHNAFHKFSFANLILLSFVFVFSSI